MEVELDNVATAMIKQKESLKDTMHNWEQIETGKESISQNLKQIGPTLERPLNFGTLEDLSSELQQTKEVCKQSEDLSVQAENLVKKSSDIKLGEKGKRLLQEKTRSVQDNVKHVKETLAENIRKMENAKDTWEKYDLDFETLFTWISEREKELSDLEPSDISPELQVIRIQEILKDLQNKSNAVKELEAQSQTFDECISSAEMARIKAKLSQMVKYWDGLKEHACRLEESILGNAEQQQKFDDTIRQIQTTLENIEASLALPVTNCSSASETYKVLHSHQDLCHDVEMLKNNIHSLSAGKLSDKSKAMQVISNLQTRFDVVTTQAQERLSLVEQLLARWQRQEKEFSSFVTWLETSEALVCPQQERFSANKSKLEAEMKSLQDLNAELTTQSQRYTVLVQLCASLYPTSSENNVQQLRDNLEKLSLRWNILPEAVLKRICAVESIVAEHQKFDDLLLEYSLWIKQFLKDLEDAAEINTSEHESAVLLNKNNRAKVKIQQEEIDNLKDELTKLYRLTIPDDHFILEGRVTDCVQLFEETIQITERRQQSLSKLGTFLQMHQESLNVLCNLKETVEGASSLDRGKSESLEKDINRVAQEMDELTAMSVGLDAALTKAQYHLKSSTSEQRTSCRALADNLNMELEKVQKFLGTKRSEAEALGALWKSFLDCREKLLKTIEDIEEKADSEEMKEPTLQALQQRLKIFNELEEEINSYQHEKQWLMDKAKQISQKDLSKAAEADKELNGLIMTWEDTNKLITESQEQCSVLIDVMKEYEHLRSSITRVIENVENMITIKSTLKDQDDIRRTITKHESAKNELNENQKELDEFTNKGKHLLVELKRIHGCDSRPVKKDMDYYMDQWLDVMERIDENLDRLSVSLSVWEDVLGINDEIDGWSSSSISQMSENITNLNSSQQMKACLAEFQTEVTLKGEKLEEFHSKVIELKELTRSKEPPAELQFMAADLKQKLDHAKEVSQVAKGTLHDFSTQKMQLETFIDQMTGWLNKVDESVLKYENSREPGDMKKLKEMQIELQTQQSSIDTTQENLNTLCRQFRSAELEVIGSTLTALIKKHEATNQLCFKTQAALQEKLEKQFTDTIAEFDEWFVDMKRGVKGSSDWSGDSKTLEGKIQQLQEILESISEGQHKLDAATEEGEKLYFCLPKTVVLSMQERISKAEKEFQSFKKQCLKDRQSLEDCISELGSFEDQHKKLNMWIHEFDERIRTETLGESKQHIPEKKSEMHKVEMFLEELLAARDSFEKLCQRAQVLHEDGRGDGQEVRLSSQLNTNYQNLVKVVKEKLRICQVALQEHQIFEEALQITWSWLKDMQDKLSTTDSTVGSKSTLENRLQQVQEMLLVKGEGEVKLNLAIGKGEQAIKSSNMDGQMVIQMQLQTLKDVWGTVNSTAARCLSGLEAVIGQWNEYTERKSQMEQWLESVDHKLEQPVQHPNGLKEKFALLDHIQAILSDIEDHSTTLHHLIEKTKELHQKTEDTTFSDIAQNELKTHFNDIMTVAKEKMRNIEDIVKDHLLYLDAVHEFSDWLHSAKEELHRWSDASGDIAAIQKKIAKIKELMDSRQTGAERLSRVEALAPAVKKNTTASGCEQMEVEIQGLQADWKQWEESVCQSQNTLQALLSQMAISEQEFTSGVSKLEDAVQDFSVFLGKWAQKLMQVEGKNTDKEMVESWHRQKEALSALTEAEHVTDDLKTQLNELCQFSKDLSVYSAKVSALIKEYNSLCLQTSKSCQSKEQILQQRFRTAVRDFQQWLINAKVMTAKCFDSPQSIDEVSASLQRIQEFLSKSESGQQKLLMVTSRGELLCSIMPEEKVKTIQKKVLTAKDDWKSFISSLHLKESTLENLKVQMRDFETSAKPVQEWLGNTERIVQDSNNRLHDLPSKRKEQQKLQSILEEISCHEPQITRLKEKAQQLREGQSSNKSYMQRVSQLSSQYLALSSLTKEKMSRMDRIVAEHQQFSHGLTDLQDWINDAIHLLQTYCHPTADKSVLDSRLSKLETLLLVKQDKEIQMKMILTRGESVLRNTSPDGDPAIQQQLKDLKDSWASLLSSCIKCKSQLEGALSKWTSYQDDVRQFSCWMDRVEERLNEPERHYNELRDKISAQSKAKLLNEEILSHSSLLKTIEKKGSSMTENYVTQLELQDLHEHYNKLKENVKEAITKSEKIVSDHQNYQKALRAFEDWLPQENEKLNCLVLFDGAAEMYDSTLQELQELQMRCAEGQALLNSTLHIREDVIPWGIPHTEDRELESLRHDWQVYQQRLTEGRSQINASLSKLKLMEKKFQKTDEWLTSVEGKVNIRTGRQSDRATKEIQLQQMKKWHEEVMVYKDEVEEVGTLAQQVLEEGRSSRIGSMATLLTSRYQAVRLHILEQIQFLEEEIKNIEESDVAIKYYTDWFTDALQNFNYMTADMGVVDKTALEKKMKKLETLLGDMDLGHRLLKALREKGERVRKYLTGEEADQLEKDINNHVERLEELTTSVRKEHTALEKALHHAKEFSDKYSGQVQWLTEYQNILQADVEPKTELYEKKAQLAKYKSIQQTVFSREPSIKVVIEKGEALHRMTHDASLGEKIYKLQKDYQGLCNLAKMTVAELVEKVKEHECYNSELQDVEKWLLQMSSRLVTPDLMESSSLETITQQLANHKAMMEDIAGFEERLNSLKLKGENLVHHCVEHLQAKFKQTIQAHLQGTRDSYSAICSTVQRVYLSLENELQKHVSNQDTLLQCQAWYSTIKKELEQRTKAPICLAEATKQVKHYRTLQEQANTYLDLLCTACDLSDGAVKNVAINIQQTKQTIEQRMMQSQDLANGWEEVQQMKVEIQTYFQEAGQQLQNLKRKRAELELKLAQNMVSQLKEFSQKLQSQQDQITSFTEKVNKLTNGQESPEHADIGQLSSRWLDFCFQINNLLQQREEDLQRTRDYHDRLGIVDVFLEKLTTEWDNLARSDTESTAVHLEALKTLGSILQERRFALEDLKEQKQKIIDHLNVDDKDLVKEQTRHFEQRWTQLEDLVKSKILTCATTLEELSYLNSRLQELTEWAEDQQPTMSEALKQSPPPELAQNLLMDHLTICSEVETKQVLLKNLIRDADKIMANLGLNERQQLQKGLEDSQKHVDCLSDLVNQRKRHLNKALSERAQFLMAAYQALNQIQHHEKKVMFQEHICLLPDDVSKQIRTCKNVQASLKTYQSDINSLWNQGRELMKEATEQEKSEVLGKLQELQNVFDSTLQKCGQRLIELEKSFVSRKFFKEDLDKACHWIKQADVLTFPEINLMNDDSELYSQLSKYQIILEQAPEYENLLLSLQRNGQEILPSLNEVERSYLDEKLNSLPQQCNCVATLAKEKLGKVQEAIFIRKEYVSLIDLTSKALKELEDHFLLMNKVPSSLSAEEALTLQQDYATLLNEVVTFGTAVNELNQKKEIFRSTGQPWLPEEMLQLVCQYHKLKRTIEQRVSQLADTKDAYRRNEDLCSNLNIKFDSLNKEFEQVNRETLPAEDKLKSYRTLAANLHDAGTLLRQVTEHLDELSPMLDPSAYETAELQVQQWHEKLKSWHSVMKERMGECENRLIQSIDFHIEICRTLEWLRQKKVELNEPLALDGKPESVQEDIRKLQIQQEEIASSLRIMNALSNREKQKYLQAKEFVPVDLDKSISELSELDREINEAISGRQTTLDKTYITSQRYHRSLQSASNWLGEAHQILQQTSNGVDIETAEDTLKDCTNFFSSENKFNGLIDELRILISKLEGCVNKSGLDQLKQTVASIKKKGKETKEQAQTQLELLRRCTVQWHLYQEDRNQVVISLNEADKKLFKFLVTKDISCHKAEEKLAAHKTLVNLVNSFHEKITSLEEKASSMEKLGNNASKATISKSMSTVWQRWTRLRGTAREQEKLLEEAVQEWQELSDKIQESTLAIDQLQEHLPDSCTEKASKAELVELLESHETFSRDLEQEYSAVNRLRQHALNGLLRDVHTESAAVEDLPVIQEMKAMLDRCSNMQQKVKKSKKLVEQELKERENVEKELNIVKAWISDTKDTLRNSTSEGDTQLEEFQVLCQELNSHRQKVEKLSEEQQNKYLEMYTILPSELSLLLAEVALALANINGEIQMKQKEAQQNQTLYQELDKKITATEGELNSILGKLKEKSIDVAEAREDHKILCEELDKCNIKLVELDAAVQDFAEQNHTLGKDLVDKIGKLIELQQQASKQAEHRAGKVTQAVIHLEEYNEILEFILQWIEKSKILVNTNIIWNSASHLRDQAMAHQALLEESRDIHSDLEAMNEKIEYLSSVYQTEELSQQVSEFGRQTEELQQTIKHRLQNLQDAAKDMKKFESEVRALQTALEQAQTTLTSPELGRLSLKEQLSHRQHLLTKMESLKPKVHAVQLCQSALRIPEEVVTSLPICRIAVRLQEETSRLQHTAIQQCNIMQEAVVQYEQYEQEVKHLQHLIEEAHLELQDAKVTTSNIQELQIQIKRHEELAKKIKGYQEQIAALNSKCKLLTMKAKHATMLLTVTEVEGLAEGMEELDAELLPSHSAHPSVVMDIAYYQALSAEQLQTDAAKNQPNTASPQEMYEPGIEIAANAKLDDLQRSWETLKNVISEKQRSLYEALERQQRYQDSLQSISTKMEAVEVKLNESLEPRKTPESQMAEHQTLMDEILMLQEEISKLQASFADELDSESLDSEAADQLALQSTLTVLAERMATIRMKALGKRQLLEEKLNEQLEEQRHEQALQRYSTEADELDHWLLGARATLNNVLRAFEEPMDMEAQLIDCQNMLLEIEQKVVALSELSVHSENLLMEGKAHTKEEAEQLSMKLRTLKGSLLELQRVLQDKQISIQGTYNEKEESESELSSSQSPSVQEWLVQARTTRSLQRQSSLQKQKELEQELTEQKKLLQSVASRGGEIINQQITSDRSNISERPDSLSRELGLEGVKPTSQNLMRKKWKTLHQELCTKEKLVQNALQQEQEQPIFNKTNRIISGVPFYKGDKQVQDKSSVVNILDGLNQALEDISSQNGVGEKKILPLEKKLYEAVSATSTWLDDVEERLFVQTALQPEQTETCLYNQETLAKDIKEMTEEVDKNKNLFFQTFTSSGDHHEIIEDTLYCLLGRLNSLESVVNIRCCQMKERLQDLLTFQNDLKLLFTSLADSKYIILHKLAEAAERPAKDQMQAIMHAEDSLKELDTEITELKKCGEKLQVDQQSMQELSKLQDTYDELMMVISSRRSALNQNLALKNQYERALQDLADLIETGQEKMSGGQKCIVSSRHEVNIMLDKHKEYFQGLESHMILTETLFRKISSYSSSRETQHHSDLMAKASAVLKQSHKRGVELEYILETWMALDDKYLKLSRQLESIESNIPVVGLVEETEERLTERIELYQCFKSSLAEHQPKLYQVLEDGKRLLMSVNCPELEGLLSQLGEQWLNNTSKVSKELNRFENILKSWTRYKNESAELLHWLRSAMDRLDFWTEQSVTVPQELETVRDHLNAFLEFSKEVDAKSSLKSSVLSTGNQLLRLKKVDTASLRSELAQIDNQWTELLTHIPVVQEKLHQLQMDKLPSRHAIIEVMTWISLMENVIKEDEENIRNVVGCEAIHEYLLKYKGFKIDINCKQLTVDFVNQSVLQISSQDVESKRSDKTDFAEKLGTMNRRWQILQGLITEKIQMLERLLESWTEYKNNVQTLKSWYEKQEKKLQKQQSIGDQASVQNSLKECQELEEAVKAKEKDLEKVGQNGISLLQNKKERATAIVMDTLSELNQSWANLDCKVCQLKILLQSVLDQWSIYKEVYEELNSYLMEARYSLSRFRLLTGSMEAVKVQVDNLQSLQEELEKHEAVLNKFGSVTNKLLNECNSSVVETLKSTLKEVTTRWNSLLEDIAEQLHSSKTLLQMWQKYKDFCIQCTNSVQLQEDRTNQLLKTAANKDIGDEEITTWIQECSVLLKNLCAAKSSLAVLQETGEQLKQQVDSSASATILSDHLSLSQRLSVLDQALQRQQAILQAGVLDYETFVKSLEDLEMWLLEAGEVLNGQDPNRSSDLSTIQERMEELKRQMLKFSSLAPDLDRLNELGYRLPLNDKEIKRMQCLNRTWTMVSSQTTERFSKLQSFLLHHQTFLEKCETWMEFLIQTEQKLAVEIPGNYQSLLEQQRAHELFQAEMFSRQQILHSIIADGQRLLEQGQVDDRDEFNLKLTLLSNQWQGVIRRAQQRRGIIDSQIRQWQRYREMAEKLRKWLVEMSYQPVTGLGSIPIPLQQARTLLDEVQLRDRVLHRQQGSYILTVEAGKQLLLSADSEAEASLQAELIDIQERWKATTVRLEEQKKQLAFLLKDWEKCDKGIAESLEKLRTFRKNISQLLPDHHDELHTEQIRCKELENAVEGWVEDLAHLTELKNSFSPFINADDISILNERIELLQRQWEELCHQVSVRRQQVSERLNEWAIFNEKNKELCEWLTQMESKVSQNGDISIEEMIEKLKKDYQEEIAVFRENKMQLQQMGERLAKASHESKASEIDYKLSKVNERWQHLLDLIGARVKKLKETLLAVQQLDKNMSSLRTWLGHIESELSKPIVYETSDSEEIERKLNEQQELQRDIEKHSTGVASVMNLCEVLLHDCDACANDTECDSIQQAIRSLDRRWRNICAMSMERRLKIEETKRLWQKFLDDFSRFEDWLKISERTAALPSSSSVLYTVAKEELKKFEAFQRQVHESLTQLELINKQYRRLARENRTDSACKLKQMVHEGNQRWDNLQKRVTSILRRLKHFIGQREEFETARDSILVWLTEMDLQLTNIEHFSECDVQAKIKQLKAFQQEIALNNNKIDQIITQGEQLIEKSEPLDAAVIEEELDELRRYCLEVFGRVERYHKKLIRLPLTDDEHDFSDREMDGDETADLSDLPWHTKTTGGSPSPLPSSNHSLSLIVPMRSERSGRDTPASVDSIPLEWDHDYDLSRDFETAISQVLHSDEEDDEQVKSYFSQGATGLTDVEIPESPEAYIKLTENVLKQSTGESGLLETQIRQLDKALDTSRFHLQQTENVIRSRTPTGPELDSSYTGYMKLLGECRGSIDTVRRVSDNLKEEELTGFINLNSTETQSAGVIERWELIHAQALNKELRMKQKLQQWQQFMSDLDNIWDWLGETEEELAKLRQLDASTDIQTIEQRIKKLKELQKAVDGRKAIVLSINLCSSEFTQADTSESKELQERLRQMNLRWDRVGSILEDWRCSLQDALMQCQDFHEMSHGLLLWLENIDRRRNEIVPINPSLDADTLQDHHKLLTQIKRELLESQLKVASLQDMSCQLLVNAEGKDCLEAKEKVHVIGNRLKVLLKKVTQHIKQIEKILDISSSQLELSSWSSADELDTSGSLSPVSGRSTPSRERTPRGKCSVSQPGPSVNNPPSRSKDGGSSSCHSDANVAQGHQSFFLRVLRAALPLQLLLLLLIGLACLVPMTEEDYSCTLSNNFARSFHPMLRYTNGPPPI
ncbi:nesprin-1 isoform X3 [Rhinoderma darwinii]|uniref:nesprin-1 isoform X3 n=1 Tax=Rhinoderma darwinii TaxID=43563 RepID=UPI003F674FB8